MRATTVGKRDHEIWLAKLPHRGMPTNAGQYGRCVGVRTMRYGWQGSHIEGCLPIPANVAEAPDGMDAIVQKGTIFRVWHGGIESGDARF